MDSKKEKEELLLKKGSLLRSRIYPQNQVPEELHTFINRDPGYTGMFFEIVLNDDLFLMIEKRNLKSCSCRIPVLQNHITDSVNKAHRELLKKFSPDGTTNRSVFEVVYYEDSKGCWKPLDSLRSKIAPKSDELKNAKLLLSKLDKNGQLGIFTQLIDWIIDIPEINTVADALSEIKVEHLQKVSTLIGISNIRKAIKFWEDNKENSDEEFWQAFLKNNSYIISQIFLFPIIILKDKAYVGGKGISNAGGNLLDFLFTHKLNGNVALVEIKTPMTPMLGSKYRIGAYSVSPDLSGSINQVLNYKDFLTKEYDSLLRRSLHDFQVFDPKCVVIAGCIESLRDEEKLRSFELFRSDLKNVQIVTYDELFNKLEMLLHLLEGSATA